MKFGGTGWNWMSSGNSSCKKDFSVRRWLSKIQVLFDRMGQEERIVQAGDNRSVLLFVYHVAEGCEDTKTDRFDGGAKDILDRDSEWRGTNMSSIDDSID